MKCALLFLLFAVASANTITNTVTPIQKVVQLLNDMKKQGEKEMHVEQVQFEAYDQWCSDTQHEKTQDIKDGKANITSLTATIEKNDQIAANLGKEIEEHQRQIQYYTGDKNSATIVRKMEKDAFKKLHTDLSESVSALERAINVLKKENYDRKQASDSLLDVQHLIPMESSKELQSFLQDVHNPEAHGYEFQSQSVIDLLEDLLGKFKQQRKDAEKKEQNYQFEYELLMQQLTDEITNETDLSEKKSAQKAEAQTTSGKAQAERSDAQSNLKADETYLADTTATCEQKTSDFKERQDLRGDEISAIDEAINILSNTKMQQGAARLPSFVQLRSSNASTSSQQLLKQKVVDLLASRADSLNSKELSMLAVSATFDPFVKVRKMVKDLITRLMEEANQEAKHHGYCNTELGKNKMMREKHTTALNNSQSDKETLTAYIAKTTEDIATLNAEVLQLQKSLATRTTERNGEEDENTVAIRDAQEAQVAVSRAVQVLKEFYEKAGNATAFVQQGTNQPAIFDKPYQGMQGESGGVMGMLEVIQSDFVRLENDTKLAEETQAKEFLQFSRDTEVTVKAKSTSIKHKEGQLRTAKGDLTTAQEELDNATQMLDAANVVYDKLKVQCIKPKVSYEERVKQREEEIQSLKEALNVLNGEA